MTDIALLGIQVNTTTVPVATKQLDAMTVSAGKAEMAAQDLAAVSRGRLVTGMSAGGNQSRMMAMQLSQVAQQASATGNVVQALAIQLPDMALGFGAVGIAAGVLASVALPAIASAFGAGAEGSKAFADALEKAGEQIEQSAALAKIAAGDIGDITAAYGEVTSAIVALVDAQADVSLRNLADAASSLTAELTAMYNGNAWLNVSRAEDLSNGLDLGAESARELTAAMVSLSQDQTLDGQISKTAEMRENFLRMVGPVGQMTASQFEFYRAIADSEAALRATRKRAEEVATASDKAKTTLNQLPAILASAASAADSAAAAVGGIGTAASNAYGAVASLVGKMWEMGQARAAYSEGIGGGRSAGMGGPALDPYGFRAQLGKSAPKMAGVGGGGGGGGADPYQSQLDALVENLRSERSIEDEWYAENLAILTDRRAEEIMGKQAHDAALLSLHEEYNRRISEIDGSANSTRLTEASNLFGALASVAEAGGKKQLKTHATLAAAATIISGYQAAMDAAAKAPTLGGKIAAYALWIGQAAKAVSAIRSAGGAGGGGGFSGGSIAAQGATAATGQNIEYRVYGLERDAVYSGAFIEKIFAGLMEEGKKRGLNTQTVQFV